MALSKITNLSITDDAVRTVGIQDNNVTLAKLGDGTQGDILYYGASGAPARLGFGTSGDFLKTQGTGANPVWATPGGGKVLQVINATTTTETAMTSTTFADTTLTADITPAATANKILVIVNQFFANYRTSASTIGAGLQLLRGVSVIYNPKASGAGGRNFWLNATGTTYLDLQMIYSFSYLDSPSTTSATTYKTQQAIAEDDNQTAVSQLDSGVSTIILMEIEG